MPASTADPLRVIVRADASPAIGLGHVTRSLALARRLADDGWSVSMLGSGVPPSIVAEAGDAGIAVAVADEGTLGFGASAGDARPQPDLVVVDGYHFGREVFDELEHLGVPHAVIDDAAVTPCRRPIALVDTHPLVDPSTYGHLEDSPRLLLGSDHALVRRSVVEVARRSPDRVPGTVFVAFGASDVRGLTVDVAELLAAEGWTVRVAVGPVHADRGSVVETLTAIGGVTVVEPGAYLEELATAHVAVLGAGTSMWEAAHLATPTVAVVLAANQREPAAGALAEGYVRAVVDVGPDLAADLAAVLVPAVRAVLAGPAADGAGWLPDGTGRVAAALLELVGGGLRLRPATPADARFLFDLRTDPDVAAVSFGAAPAWEEHVVWLDDVIADDDRRLAVVELGPVRIGQVRLDRMAERERERGARRGSWEISIAIARDWRGRELAGPTIGAAIASVDERSDLVARIRPGNRRSLAAFAAAGFRCESEGAEEIVMRHRALGPTPESVA